MVERFIRELIDKNSAALERLRGGLIGMPLAYAPGSGTGVPAALRHSRRASF